MKRFPLLLGFLVLCSFALVSASMGSEQDPEFKAARKLESLCDYSSFFNPEENGDWENGKYVYEDDEGKLQELPITEAALECETLNAKIIKQIMKLKHLRVLSVQFCSLQDVEFPVHELKELEELEILQNFFPYEEVDDSSEEELPAPAEERQLPQRWCESIGASRTIRILRIPAQKQVFQEVLKMPQLQSLTLNNFKGGDLLPMLLPRKDSLRELEIQCEMTPQEAADVLKNFTSLQALALECFRMSDPCDDFLKAIKCLPLRYLAISDGKIGPEGEKILREWESLQEVVLPRGFPEERFKALEKIEVPVLLYQLNQDRELDGTQKIEMRQKFFDEVMLRSSRIDKEGNYIHWAEIHSGLWMVH